MEAEKAPKKVHRSPNYPAFSLSDAIKKARIVYGHEKKSATTPEVIAKHLGYSQTTGPGGRALSGLRQYGLLEESNGHYRLSDLGFTLIHFPDDAPERVSALATAIRKPTLFSELLKEYPDGLPSDQTLKSNLLRRGFNPSVIDEAVRSFRDSVNLVENGNVGYTDPEQENMDARTMENVPPIQDERKGRLTPEQQRAQFQTFPPTGRTPVGSEIPVAKDCVMGVNASGRVTQEGIDKLIQYLGLIKGSFPKESESVQ